MKNLNSFVGNCYHCVDTEDKAVWYIKVLRVSETDVTQYLGVLLYMLDLETLTIHKDFQSFNVTDNAVTIDWFVHDDIHYTKISVEQFSKLERISPYLLQS